jgi:hypothetical protein
MRFYSFENWLASRLRLRYILLALVVVITAAWIADAAGWLPAAEPVGVVERRAGY